jgi:hypothetical protein
LQAAHDWLHKGSLPWARSYNCYMPCRSLPDTIFGSMASPNKLIFENVNYFLTNGFIHNNFSTNLPRLKIPLQGFDNAWIDKLPL